MVGWATYGLIILLTFSLTNENPLSLRNYTFVGLLCGFCVLLTHFFRWIVINYNWTKLPQWQLLLQVVAANLVLAIVLFFIYAGLDRITNFPPIEWSGRGILVLLINFTILFLLWSLLYFTFHFFRDFRQRQIEHLRWESAIKDFELRKLKSQLNPHFVFNALNSIRALVDEDPEKAKLSITQLSNLLRNSLIADRSKTITLAEEMRTVNDYLNLEKLRYEERLNVIIDIDHEALNVQVPPMMIQTIVENAVKHGISKQLAQGFIAVEAHLHRNNLDIAVKNSGTYHGQETGGFGIINTKQRLELLYGSSEGFAILQESDNVVAVNISIPVSK